MLLWVERDAADERDIGWRNAVKLRNVPSYMAGSSWCHYLQVVHHTFETWGVVVFRQFEVNSE